MLTKKYVIEKVKDLVKESMAQTFHLNVRKEKQFGLDFEVFEYSFTVENVDYICVISPTLWQKHDYDIGFIRNGGSTKEIIGKDLDFMNSVFKTVANCMIDFINRTDKVKNLLFDANKKREKAYVRFLRQHPFFSRFEIDDSFKYSGLVRIIIRKGLGESNFINESKEDDIWFHGTTNNYLDFNSKNKGNQLPYGVHFTRDKDIAHDFATGLTKMNPTDKGYIFSCKIPSDNIFDVFDLKKWTYSEGEKYFDILKEIATANGKNYVYPSKNGVTYHQRYIDEEGFEKEIDWSQVLNNAKPNTIIKVLKRHHIKPIIRYPMIGSTDILGYNKVYNEALCVLDEKLVKILNVEQIK